MEFDPYAPPVVPPIDLDYDPIAVRKRLVDSARAREILRADGRVTEGWLVIGTGDYLDGIRGVTEHPSTYSMYPDRARLFTTQEQGIRVAKLFAYDYLMGQGLTFRVWPIDDERSPVRVDWVLHLRALRRRAMKRAPYRHDGKQIVFEALNPALWEVSRGPLAPPRVLR